MCMIAWVGMLAAPARQGLESPDGIIAVHEHPQLPAEAAARPLADGPEVGLAPKSRGAQAERVRAPVNAGCPSVRLPTLFIGRVCVGLAIEITSGKVAALAD